MYPSSPRNLFARAFEQTDNASVTYFRVIFGLLMAQWAWDYLAQGIVNRVYIQPKIHFSYYLLDWVKPQREPLLREPWDLPIGQWRSHVEMPELKFLTNAIPPEPATGSESRSALASSHP